MSEDRLERIEAALDNQVLVNAELRTSTQQLKATAEALLSTAQIHQENFEVLAVRFNTLLERQAQADTRFDEYQRATNAALERTDSKVEENQRATDAILERVAENQRATNAILERIGAVLDYLIRQQNS